MDLNLLYRIVLHLTSKHHLQFATSVMTLVYVLFIGDVMTDIGRYDDGVEADFRVVNKGRLYHTLTHFENFDYEECSSFCIQFLSCVTFNYNLDTKECELTDEDFDEEKADTDVNGWFNFGTPTKVNGGFSHWRNVSCNTKCGGGVGYQQRSCTNPEPRFGGDKCIGETSRTIVCNTHPCPIDGRFTNWTNGSCSASCGDGNLRQTRTCTNPLPQFKGVDCVGEKNRTLACNIRPCPINGGWSLWAGTTQCSKQCGGGRRKEERQCTNPAPQHGGNDCTGVEIRILSCNDHCCGRTTVKGTCCVQACSGPHNLCRDTRGFNEKCN